MILLNNLLDDTIRISFFEMIMCLSNTVDLVSKQIMGHHLRVAYICSSLAEMADLPPEAKRDVIVAGLLHDIGALSLKERLDCLTFDDDLRSPHAEVGYRLISSFSRLSPIASLVRDHHLSWRLFLELKKEGSDLSQILHLADRIDVLINPKKEILDQIPAIINNIQSRSGTVFSPKYVKIFQEVSLVESFWFDLITPIIPDLLVEKYQSQFSPLNDVDFTEFSKFISRIIDFRSRFTATHSSGVSSVAVALGKQYNLSFTKRCHLRIAGYLHDIGKLSVPDEILNKTSSLTSTEYNIIRKHPYFTYHTLARVKGLQQIAEWAAYHHEKLNGKGYPFRKESEQLCLESRIVAISDIYTALSEDRPYRKGMEKKEISTIMMDLSLQGHIDREGTEALLDNLEEINRIRLYSQINEGNEYRQFMNTCTS